MVTMADQLMTQVPGDGGCSTSNLVDFVDHRWRLSLQHRSVPFAVLLGSTAVCLTRSALFLGANDAWHRRRQGVPIFLRATRMVVLQPSPQSHQVATADRPYLCVSVLHPLQVL
jgi:hypothetical protein